MNNNAISQSPAHNLYLVHSTEQKKEEKHIRKEEKQPAPAPQVPTYQYNNRSYYNDSMGGGYQGL